MEKTLFVWRACRGSSVGRRSEQAVGRYLYVKVLFEHQRCDIASYISHGVSSYTVGDKSAPRKCPQIKTKTNMGCYGLERPGSSQVMMVDWMTVVVSGAMRENSSQPMGLNVVVEQRVLLVLLHLRSSFVVRLRQESLMARHSPVANQSLALGSGTSRTALKRARRNPEWAATAILDSGLSRSQSTNLEARSTIEAVVSRESGTHKGSSSSSKSE
jgi:hypothetical protein